MARLLREASRAQVEGIRAVVKWEVKGSRESMVFFRTLGEAEKYKKEMVKSWERWNRIQLKKTPSRVIEYGIEVLSIGSIGQVECRFI